MNRKPVRDPAGQGIQADIEHITAHGLGEQQSQDNYGQRNQITQQTLVDDDTS